MKPQQSHCQGRQRPTQLPPQGASREGWVSSFGTGAPLATTLLGIDGSCKCIRGNGPLHKLAVRGLVPEHNGMSSLQTCRGITSENRRIGLSECRATAWTSRSEVHAPGFANASKYAWKSVSEQSLSFGSFDHLKPSGLLPVVPNLSNFCATATLHPTT